jgi:hypothetical protein
MECPVATSKGSLLRGLVGNNVMAYHYTLAQELISCLIGNHLKEAKEDGYQIGLIVV